MFVIEKGVPLPIGRITWPFRDMEVGDSFLVPAENHKKLTNSVQACKRRHHDMTFAVRKVEGGYRCYRIA